MLYNVDDRPRPMLWLLLSFQHVFAMFGATILVPLILGMPVSVALFASGVGTLIYIIMTKAKVPIYLGSSFAFIGAMLTAGMAAAQIGLIFVGLIYIAVALIIKKIGTAWLHKLLPPIVIGPMIAVIGLGLASFAITQSDFVLGGSFKNIIVALATLSITLLAIIKGKGVIKVIPFILGLAGGYIIAAFLGLVDFSSVIEAPLFALPEFKIPYIHYTPNFGPAMWAILPVAIVTISEHIGDHTVLGKICNKDFLQDPGLDKTLMGDGIATAVSALLGGPANTTYGENTGVIAMTKVASVAVIKVAAMIAILLSFSGTIAALIATIPAPVLGGISLMLYGVIAANGLKVLSDSNIDFSKDRNIIIPSIMLVLGIGGAAFPIGGAGVLSGTALAGIAGVLLNKILPKAD